MKGVSSIGEIIPKIIKSIGLKKKAEQNQVLFEWDSIVGEQLSEKTKPIGVKRGILRVLVESSVWMNELQLMKPVLMEKIEGKIGRNKIKDIKFCLGKIEKVNE